MCWSSAPSSPDLAQLQQLLEVEQLGLVLRLAVLVVLGLAHGAGDAVELHQVTVDVERIGHHAVDLAPGDVADVGDPARVEGLAGGDRELGVADRDRQDAVLGRVGRGDHLADRAHVDLGRVDALVGQRRVARDPLGQVLEVDRGAGGLRVLELGVGDHHQRVHLRAPGAALRVAHALGVGLGQHALVQQHRQHLVGVQAPVGREAGRARAVLAGHGHHARGGWLAHRIPRGHRYTSAPFAAIPSTPSCQR